MEKVINSSEKAVSEKATFISKTYGWMGLALLISALSAFVTARSTFFTDTGTLTAFGTFLYVNKGFLIFAIAELLLVWFLSASIRKISLAMTTFGFIAYSLLNGITLSAIFLVYEIESIAIAFVGTSVMFFAMAFYGLTTKKNLATMGKYLMMALIGLIVVSLIEGLMYFVFKLNTSILDFLISIATVIIFTGLTAYDSQKIMKVAEHSNGNEDYKKVSIMAALSLYLDFINLFLALLRIFGRKK